MESNASKVEIKNEISRFDKKLYQPKEQLTHMVPYRALVGFFANAGERVDWESTRRLIAYVEAFSKEKRSLPYIFGEGSRLRREVIFHPDWIRMLRDNTASILGWIQYEKVKWLQRQSSFHLGRTGAVPKGKYAGRVLQHSAKEYAAGV